MSKVIAVANQKGGVGKTTSAVNIAAWLGAKGKKTLLVFATVIPRTVRLSEAPSYGQPILYYDKSNKGCIAYGALVDEILKKNR